MSEQNIGRGQFSATVLDKLCGAWADFEYFFVLTTYLPTNVKNIN